MRIKFTLLLLLFILASKCVGQVYYMDSNNGQTISTCRGVFYSSGGDPYACFGYFDNENYTVTFCSGTPGVPLRVSFITWDIEAGFDFLKIYDGPTTGSPLLGTI